MITDHNNRGTWGALIAGCIFGINSIVVKIGTLHGVSILNILLCQYALALVWFNAKRLRQRSGHPPLSIHTLLKNPYNWVAGIAGGLTGLLYYAAIALTKPSIAALGLFQYPWMLVILGVLFYRERITFRVITITGLVWAGTILSMGLGPHRFNILGLLLSLLAAGTFAIYLWSLQRVSPSSTSQAFIVLVAAIITVIFALMHLKLLSRLTNAALFFGGLSAILGQVLTFELLSFAAKRISSTTMATLTTTELVVAVGLSWAIWGPSPHIEQILGLILMFSSIIWLKRQKSSPAVDAKNSLTQGKSHL